MKASQLAILLLTNIIFYSCGHKRVDKNDLIPEVNEVVKEFIPISEAGEISYNALNNIDQAPHTFINTTSKKEVSLLHHLDETDFHFYQGVKFKNENVGAIMGGTRLKTRITQDGGKTWNEYSFSRFANAFQSADFVGNDIFIVGASSYIFKGENLGKNWRVFDTKYFFQNDQSRYQKFKYYKVRFLNEKTGFIVGERQQHAVILKTEDGGDHWEVMPSNNALKDDKGVSDIAILSANELIITTLSGNCYKSLDGGENWELLYSGEKSALSSIAFFDANVGFIGGINNVFLYTNDAGKTWKKIHLPYGEIADIDIYKHSAIVTTAYYALEEPRTFVFKIDDEGANVQPFLTKEDDSVLFMADSYDVDVLDDQIYILDRNNLYQTVIE